MTTAEVCVSQNFEVSATGQLAAAEWSVPVVVATATGTSTGDGALTAQTTLPGKQMIDVSLSWTNPRALEVELLLRVQRSYRDLLTSNPNVIQVRDRWTSRISAEPTDLAPVPDPTSVFNSQWGGGIDLSTNTTATPQAGRLWLFEDAHFTEDWMGPVPPGYTLNVRYRAYVWTPPPFADNANNNAPTHQVNLRQTTLQFTAMPERDTMTNGG